MAETHFIIFVKNKLKLFLLLWISIHCQLSFSGVLEVGRPDRPVDIWRLFEQATDCENKTVEEMHLSSEVKWKPVEKFNLGFFKCKIWLRFSISNKSDQVFSEIFDVGFHFFREIELHSFRGVDIIHTQKSGRIYRFENRYLMIPNFNFLLDIEPGDTIAYLIGIDTPGVVKIPAMIGSKEVIEKKSNSALTVMIFFLGAVVFYLILFLLKDHSFNALAYFAYVASSVLFLFDIDGLLFQYLWPNNMWWPIRSSGVIVSFSIVFFCLFVASYSKIKNRISIYLTGLVLVSQAAFAITYLFTVDPNLILSHHITIVLSLLVCLVIAYLEYCPTKSNRYYVFSYIGILVSAVIFVAQNIGFVGTSLLTEYSVFYGLLIQITFISAGISAKNDELVARAYLLEKKLTIQKAVAETTQMLAHDVRKPFSMVQAFLDLFEAIDDQQKTRELAARFVPEIKKAITSVNGMISDVMEIGSDTIPSRIPVSPEQLILEGLSVVFGYEKNGDIQFSYELKHDRFVDADPLKMTRVLSNIIANAAQAMKFSGEIWFKTKNIAINKIHFVEFCIGNSGSSISQGNIDNLFEPFFTKGKAGGTGLGLAIAKKVVESHGGLIRCQSGSSGVEFFFTLPVCSSKKTVANHDKLPKTSQAITEKLTICSDFAADAAT